jgi:hypothetical protein
MDQDLKTISAERPRPVTTGAETGRSHRAAAADAGDVCAPPDGPATADLPTLLDLRA